jgi:hypothetical protein
VGAGIEERRKGRQKKTRNDEQGSFVRKGQYQYWALNRHRFYDTKLRLDLAGVRVRVK